MKSSSLILFAGGAFAEMPALPIASFLNNLGGQAPQLVVPAVARLRATHERAIDLQQDYLHLLENIGALPRTFLDNLIPDEAAPAIAADGRPVVSVPQVVSAVLGPFRFLSDLLTLPSQLIVRPANVLLEVERNILDQTEIVEPILEGAQAAVAQHRQQRARGVPQQVAQPPPQQPARPIDPITEDMRAELKKRIVEAWSKSMLESTATP
eukprot:Blabericola_migrator_1__4352@NODE_233_length_11060_cov_144_333303_g198_i0_p6_GENE_NODE_233_length_11060_cov_144_333303_g198_i0NODE_233_length_11060_cov_144_333303_g198_i0_p6_ORF_typecomplete_len210_score38_52_NODE_233_length_11060_cov_144_333303_g198_i080538682